MKKALLDVIFASEKRKSTLLLLHGGPVEMEGLLSSLKTTRQALLPQIRILEEHYLVFHNQDTYELTTIGKLIVNGMQPFVESIENLDDCIDYWGNRKLDFIPPHLFERISKLGKCKVISPSIVDMYETLRIFHEASKRSKSLFLATTFLYPNFDDLFSELLGRGIGVNIIMSRELFNKLQAEKNAHFANFLKSELFQAYSYSRGMEFISFAYNDHYLRMNPLRNDGELDSTQVLCSTPNAILFGEELFRYYLRDSCPVSEL